MKLTEILGAIIAFVLFLLIIALFLSPIILLIVIIVKKSKAKGKTNTKTNNHIMNTSSIHPNNSGTYFPPVPPNNNTANVPPIRPNINSRNSAPTQPNYSTPNYNFNSHNTQTNDAQKQSQGTFGEYLIAQQLREAPGFKHVLPNCYIKSANGQPTEIDLIMIHEKGIFVFESKNFTGWIYGKESQDQWTQTFANGRKEHFFNPIKQNANHIKNLKLYLNNNEYTFYSIIVFGDNCTLKNIDYKQSNQLFVINSHDIPELLSGYMRYAPDCLSKSEIDSIAVKLLPCSENTIEEKENHVNQINDTYRR